MGGCANRVRIKSASYLPDVVQIRYYYHSCGSTTGFYLLWVSDVHCRLYGVCSPEQIIQNWLFLGMFNVCFFYNLKIEFRIWNPAESLRWINNSITIENWWYLILPLTKVVAFFPIPDCFIFQNFVHHVETFVNPSIF